MLKCSVDDSYGVEAGNRKLTYPVGLLTIDEAILSGTSWSTRSNTNYYLHTYEWYWLLSPDSWENSPYYIGSAVLHVYNDGSPGKHNGVNSSTVEDFSGVRPALTIAPSAPLLSGDGSQNNPYVI